MFEYTRPGAGPFSFCEMIDGEMMQKARTELGRFVETGRIRDGPIRALRVLGGHAMTNELSRNQRDESYEEYARKMDLLENGPTTTNFQQLLDKGVYLPEPDAIPDAEIRTKLWEVLVGLADLQVFLDHTDHLSDRELYAKLWFEILREEVPAIDEIGFNHVTVLHPGDDADDELYLKYFADDEWRKFWQQDHPTYVMPTREDPPFNRDYLLPVSADVQPPEALEWLRANWNESALASNRFGPTVEAIRFVEQLYAKGATQVTIGNIMMLPNHQWTPYADTLIIELPREPEKRHELFELMKDVGQPDEDGGELVEELLTDCGQSTIRLWWD